MSTIQPNSNLNNICSTQQPCKTDFENHVDRVNYFLGFLDPSSRAPGIIGMISWTALKEGLLEQKEYFNDALNNGSLSLRETDTAHNMIAKIDMALEKIS